MEIALTNTRRKSQSSTRTGSGDNPEEKNEEMKEEVQKSGRDGDSDDDSDSDRSVISLASTESQERRRLLLGVSPSKRAVELVTVQGTFTEIIYDLKLLGTGDFISCCSAADSPADRQDVIFGEWFSRSITIGHQQKLRPDFWIIQFDKEFENTIYKLYTAIVRILCVTEATPMMFKVRILMANAVGSPEEEYVPSDSYFYKAKSTIRIPRLLLSLNLDGESTTLPSFAYLSNTEAAEEELVKAGRVEQATRMAEIANAALTATENARENG